jgi:hypothetical protein
VLKIEPKKINLTTFTSFFFFFSQIFVFVVLKRFFMSGQLSLGFLGDRVLFDSLPYLDEPVPPEYERTVIQKLIEEEMKLFTPQQDYLAHLPIPPQLDFPVHLFILQIIVINVHFFFRTIPSFLQSLNESKQEKRCQT